MLETKRIERLEKRIAALQQENAELSKRNEELETNLKNINDMVAACETYTEEHNKQMLILGESRERYELAYKQMMHVKKEYEKRMEKVLKGFE